jgi:hypothetical protein
MHVHGAVPARSNRARSAKTPTSTFCCAPGVHMAQAQECILTFPFGPKFIAPSACELLARWQCPVRARTTVCVDAQS